MTRLGLPFALAGLPCALAGLFLAPAPSVAQASTASNVANITETQLEAFRPRLIGPAVRIDVSSFCLEDADYEVTIGDFQSWEDRNGTLPEGVIVLLYTGFGRHWPHRARYLGTEAQGEEAVASLHFPGLAPEAARWLVENRSIRAIGLDTPSIDFGQSKQLQSHQILFKANIPAVENVAHLERLPEKDFVIVALPMKIGGGSGGPLRIVALVPGS